MITLISNVDIKTRLTLCFVLIIVLMSVGTGILLWQSIQQQCKQSLVGKKLPDSLYVHRTAEGQLPPLLRLMILAARQIVGELEYDLIKIALDGKKLSFLRYPDFEDSPHPELAYSVRVFLPTASYGIKNFRDSDNPPILHRKETFVDPFHPRYAEFAELSAQEEALGLFGRTEIGTRKGWQAALQEKNLQLVGHSLVSTLTTEHPLQ